MRFIWLNLLLLLFVLFIVPLITVILLRRTRRTIDHPLHADFSLDQLLALLHSGKLTPEEFDRARAATLARRTDPTDTRPKGFEVLEPRDHI